jgi:hypothetical protein
VTVIPPLTVLVYMKDSQLVAHCLEMDFCTSGRSRDRVVALLYNLIRARIQSAVAQNGQINLFRQAPLHYWKRLEQAELFKECQIDLEREAVVTNFHTKKIDVREFDCC